MFVYPLEIHFISIPVCIIILGEMDNVFFRFGDRRVSLVDGPGHLSMPERPTNLVYGRAWACCTCSRFG